MKTDHALWSHSRYLYIASIRFLAANDWTQCQRLSCEYTWAHPLESECVREAYVNGSCEIDCFDFRAPRSFNHCYKWTHPNHVIAMPFFDLLRSRTNPFQLVRQQSTTRNQWHRINEECDAHLNQWCETCRKFVTIRTQLIVSHFSNEYLWRDIIW